MTEKRNRKLMAVVVTTGLLAGGCVYFQGSNNTALEGHWECTTSWTCGQDGKSVQCSAEQQASCVKTRLSSTGVISIGPAQWAETIEGRCYASEHELYGTRSTIKTVPRNEAARKFEEERLGGRSLASAAGEDHKNYRIRITSATETRLTAVNHEGRTVRCQRRAG